jgi:hypothetical protein
VKVDFSIFPLRFLYFGSPFWPSRVFCDSGAGKNHRDAAAVRTAHPIPAACGLYYFEITVVSKGRDGLELHTGISRTLFIVVACCLTRYVGIGLSVQSVGMGRLPGIWCEGGGVLVGL